MNNSPTKNNGSAIGKAVAIESLFSSIPMKILAFCFWLSGALSFVGIFLYSFKAVPANNFVYGFCLILLGLFMVYIAYRSFYLSELRHPHGFVLANLKSEQKTEENLFNYFSFELAKYSAPTIIASNQDPVLLYKSIFDSPDMIFVLVRLGIRPQDLLEPLSQSKADYSLNNVLRKAIEIGLSLGHDKIEISDVFLAFCELDSRIDRALKDQKIELDDVYNVAYWQTQIIEEEIKNSGFLNPDKLKLTGGVGKDWAYGWTPYLRQFSIDISRSINERGLGLEIVGHESEIKQIEEALLKQNGGNVIIVGEAGVGKNTTVLGFAQRIVEGKTNSSLDFKHIIKIDTNYLLAGANSSGEITNRINGLLAEAAAAGNIIIYFENFQNLVSGGDAGKVDATEVVLPFLDQVGTNVIATCDVASYNKYIASNGALNERLTRITVDEPDQNEMVRILEDIVPLIEYKTKCVVSYEAIKKSIVDADKYIMNLPNPEKTIGLLDGSAAKAASERGKTIVLPKDVDNYVAEKYQVPTGEVEEGERDKLLVLEQEMHKSVIGQSEAVSAIANSLRRVRAGIVDSKKPIGSFLFLGPTGVGKTETAKALARSYFGDEGRMIRFDMSEYQNKQDIYRLIGSNLGAEDEIGLLTTAVREHPFSLILFDEIEKANPDILDLFLQMLDEGFITDGSGRKVSFTNSIIISTSNAGANLIRESIQSGADYEKTKNQLIDYLQKDNIFRPEFINRFTSVIAFSPLSRIEIGQVANLMVQKMIQTIYKNKGVTVVVEPAAIEKLSGMGFDPQMGARPMSRTIQEKLENFLATKILSGELKNGDSITITEANIA